MAKFAGNVGFVIETVSDGVYTPQSIERFMTGDVLNVRKNKESGSKVNDDITLGNRFSLVGDAYARQNFMQIRWIEWMGQKWKVDSISLDNNAPRIEVTLGGPWNG